MRGRFVGWMVEKFRFGGGWKIEVDFVVELFCRGLMKRIVIEERESVMDRMYTRIYKF